METSGASSTSNSREAAGTDSQSSSSSNNNGNLNLTELSTSRPKTPVAQIGHTPPLQAAAAGIWFWNGILTQSARVDDSPSNRGAAAEPADDYDADDSSTSSRCSVSTGDIPRDWPSLDDELLLSIYESQLRSSTTAPFAGAIPPAGIVSRVARQTGRVARANGWPFPHSLSATRKRLLLLCTRKASLSPQGPPPASSSSLDVAQFWPRTQKQLQRLGPLHIDALDTPADPYPTPGSPRHAPSALPSSAASAAALSSPMQTMSRFTLQSKRGAALASADQQPVCWQAATGLRSPFRETPPALSKRDRAEDPCAAAEQGRHPGQTKRRMD